ncbi:DUF2163 domain-containing protein [Alterinioella nitratireducens]|uniref:DUF2163 domain-containing protein n=1 Tax=Alterinioella nitratireducens TaxID=2735915 RepID=UPI001555C610|nr:DUF2163 domain-containing protein [Alterinioella nitratireducens]NPD18310.1 DUF2163 domain-containing protein [Alterinioella nitratireducens]
MSGGEGLLAHLAGGASEVARCWRVTRADGVQYGFTDHDRALAFEGTVFKADSGLSAAALSQTTGLSVDNTEAVGALSDASIREADILAGRFDGAVVEAWLVNWSAPENRALQFKGTFGELERQGGAFQVELRGLAEPMNRPEGRVYQRPCSAVLGDAACRFDLTVSGYAHEGAVSAVADGRVLIFEGLDEFAPRWFERGRMVVLSGAAEGLVGVIKNDRFSDGARRVELWEELRAEIAAGDLVRLEAGCDKRMETCRLKFANILNFQGFPDIPGEDWVMAYPGRGSAPSDGESLR